MNISGSSSIFSTNYIPSVYGPSFTNDKSLLFDGVDEYVGISTPTGIASSNGFSVSMWIKSSSFPTSFGLFSLYTSTSDRIMCYKTTSGWRFYVCNGSSAYTNGTFSLSTGTWYHVAFVYDGTQGTIADRAKIYVNGSDVTTTASGTIPTTTSATSSYSQNAIGEYLTDEFNGNIDEVRWYNYSLNSAEVTDVYNSGTPKDDDLTTPAIHWWRMGDGDTFPTITDVGTTGGNNGTMTNMESGDIVTDTP